jgi:replicative superfamily II helicase
VKVADVVPEFADAFSFDKFNQMQQEAAPEILQNESNVVVAAPTASGKTALAELAICRTLRQNGTALFIAPLRALTNEKESEWDRFESLGYSVYVVTGERELNTRRAERADILVMTPEKTDSATRKHDSARYSFITDIDCCVIDEVHLLDSDRRGGVLEVTVSRLRRLCDPRIVALSATMSNIDDVAGWLDASSATTFQFGEDYRPVELHRDIQLYTHGDNTFADKYRRLYRALDCAEEHLRDGGQALVFVSSRQDAVRAAGKARDEIAQRDIPMGARGDYEFHTSVEKLENDALSKAAPDGVGFHHAGLAKDDRDRIESWFKSGKIQLLFSTSTLAWGVNLPARCVVIRDTKYHDPLEGEVDISPLDVLQMLGRAGRPGYDDVGYGWVVCDRSEAEKYRRLLEEGKEIESRLAEDLDSHLNAEIAMGTIKDLDDVLTWLKRTFYYQRAKSNPDAYDFGTLKQRMQSTLESLVERGFVEMDDNLSVSGTTLGRLTSKYYLRLSTAERFNALCDCERLTESDMLEVVAGAGEFHAVSARQSESDAIDRVLSDASISTELEDGSKKVLAILYAGMNGATPADLRSDAWIIRQNARRLLSALREFLASFAGPRAANLARRVAARVEHGVSRDAVALTAIDGIGATRADKLATGGLHSPADITEAGVAELKRAGLTEGVAKQIVANARDFPDINVRWESLPNQIARGTNELCEVTIRNLGGGAYVGIRITVNEVEMTSTETYLDDTITVPVGVFGADTETLEFMIEITFPAEPLHPVRAQRAVSVVSNE